MNHWKIGTRISAGFAVVIAIAMTLGAFAYHRVGMMANSASDISGNSLPSVYLMGQVEANTERMRALITALRARAAGAVNGDAVLNTFRQIVAEIA